MKYSNPKILAFINASLVVVVFILCFSLFKLVIGTSLELAMLITALAILGFSYFFFYYSLQRFILDRIRLIYKTIRHLKVPENAKKKIALKSDIEEVNQDVTEWAKERSKEIEDLKTQELYRREFLGNVSHELKTPIFNLQGYVLTLLDGGLEDPTINREYLKRTNKSINRLIAIVEDLEAIAHLESGELKVNFQKFDVVSLSREVLEFLEIKAKKKKMFITLDNGSDKPIPVSADREKIRQVFINLVDNSIKYCGVEGGKTRIRFFDMDEHVLVEVTDNGVGISEQDLSRVFERFYRTDKARSRDQGGSGLGLAIVKHIIEAHKQTINVRSTLGVGTTFGFTLEKAR
jgi:two-component system phosphate regulon sensor histidine kinase PhoR